MQADSFGDQLREIARAHTRLRLEAAAAGLLEAADPAEAAALAAYEAALGAYLDESLDRRTR